MLPPCHLRGTHDDQPHFDIRIPNPLFVAPTSIPASSRSTDALAEAVRAASVELGAERARAAAVHEAAMRRAAEDAAAALGTEPNQ